MYIHRSPSHISGQYCHCHLCNIGCKQTQCHFWFLPLYLLDKVLLCNLIVSHTHQSDEITNFHVYAADNLCSLSPYRPLYFFLTEFCVCASM